MRTTSFVLTTASALALGLFLTAETAKAGSDNRMFVEQVGNANFGGGSQAGGSNNQTWIQQTGNQNSAGGSFTGPSANNNKGLIDQDGSRNVAAWSFVADDNPMRRNNLGIVQYGGSENYANLNITQDPSPGLFDSTVFVKQEGSKNYVGDGSGFGVGFPGVPGSDAGNGSFATKITNDGTTSASHVAGPESASFSNTPGEIWGRNQFVGLFQDGVDNAFAVSMAGNGNEIGGNDGTVDDNFNSYTNGTFFSPDVTVTAPSDAGSFGVSGLAQQIGNDNVGIVRVDGFNNAVGFVQTGHSNVGEVYQDGNNNNAAIHQ
jgi:hypothetical protein